MKKTTLLPSGLRRLLPGLLLLLLFSSQGWGQANIIISEVTDAATYQAEYVEIYNAGNAPQDLLNWKLQQYGSEQPITFDGSITTNLTGNYTLSPGEYIVVFRGTLAEFTGVYAEFSGYYFTTNNASSGAPQMNGGEYYELINTEATIVDYFGSSTSTSTKLKTYERKDALSNGQDLSSDWALLANSEGSPGLSNSTIIANDLSTTPSDTDPPLLLSTIPADGSSDINISTDLSLTFNENVAKGSGNISVYNASDVLVEAVDVSTEAVTITDATAVVDLVSDLSAGESYYVMVDATAFTDLAGNPYAGISNTTDWNFSTSATLSSDATLTDLLVDGSTIAGFDAGTVAYDVELPYGTTTVPTVTYTLNDATAKAVQTNAPSLPGTTSVEVTAQDSTTKKDYRINFTVAAPSSEATVTSSSYTVDDGNETLTDIPYGTTLATFKAALTPATGAAFDVYLADGTTLATDLLSGYKVVVTAQDGTTQKTYTLTIDAELILLLEENFDYVEGTILTDNGWSAHSGTGTAPITVIAPGLEFAGYIGSGVGNAADVTSTGEDVNRGFLSLASGTLYTALIIQADASNSNGYFFHHLIGSSTSFANRLWVNASGDGLGIGTSTPTAWTPITPGTPTLVVMKYDFDGGVTSLYTFSSFPAAEPGSADLTLSETFSSIGGIALRQYSNAQNIIVDGIRVAKTWEEAVKAAPDLTAPMVSFSPLNGSSQVTETTDITLSFDEEIFNADGSAIGNDDLAAKLSFFETATPANTLPFVAGISGQQIVVDPTGDLKLGMQYTLSLLANTVEDAAGNENAESSTTFTVREARTVAEVASAVYTVDNDNSTISGVPFSEDLATFKTNVLALSGASYDVYQPDGISIASDLQDGYQLIVVAEDGLTKKTYTINKIAFVNNEAAILSFSVPEQTGAATIDADAHTISIQVPYGSNRGALIATFTLSAGATAKVGTTPQVSGETANNFETPLTYSILAEDGTTTQDWQVSITPEAPNTDASLSALFIDEVAVDGFSAEVYSYTKEYPYGTSVVPAVSYTLNDATASAEITGAESMPGTTSVKVTAQDGLTTQTYTIDFTWEAPGTEAFVTSALYTVNDTENTITGIPYGTTLAVFKTEIVPATNAAFEVYLSDGTTVADNLQSGYKVVVTAQDGVTQKIYVLTLDEAPTAELFFSEYLEGSSSNKAVEIYNPTGSDVDLSAYSVKLGTNGASWGTTLTLSGTLTAGDVYVIYNSSAAIQAIIDAGDITSGVASFNGDDALGLFKNEVLIDVIGNVGEDPGSAWTVAGVSNATVDKTLVRKAPIEIGTTDWASAAGTNTDDSQWLVYPQDEVSYLGSHVQAPDTEGPVVVFEPLNNASEVFVNVHPTLTFNENVFDASGLAFADGADVSSLLECYETATPANTVAFTASITGRVVTVIPAAALANNTQYTLVLKADAVQDKAGNPNLSSQASFTTIDASVQSLSLTYPVGGEVFYAGDEVTLTWNAANIANINVEVYVPRFDVWTELLASTDATTGSVALTVGADSYYGNTYKIRISAVDNATINEVSGDFEIIAVPQTLAALRSQGAGAKVKFAGNATVTMVQSYRNQKFIQDATAAVLIDDVAGKITSAYTIGANMSGIEGSLSEYGGMLQLIPSADPGASSGDGTEIIPEVVTMEAFASDFEAYEAELLTFEGVTFSQADGSMTFATGTSYTMSDQTNTGNFYTNFYDADYIGTILPETTGNISGIAHSRTTGNYITARFAADLSFPSNDASLSAITVDGSPLDGFDPSVLTYSVSLPAGTTEVPVLVATANEANASIEINAATSLPGTTSVKVTAQDGVSQQTYTVQFTVTPYHTDATLISLSYNGTVVEGFAPNQYEYSVVLPYGTTTLPVIAAVAADSKANVVLTQAPQLPGDASVKVTAEDMVTTLTYTIHFSVALNTDATLSDILVDGQSLTGFVPGTLEYVLPVSNESIPVVTAVANDAKASVDIVQATSVPGFASIQVTAEDNTTVLTYKVTFVDASLGHDASLNSISVDEVPLATFATDVFVYELELPYGTTTIPEVNATTTDANASLEITQATQLPGDATVLVTAEDGGTQQTYTVKFSVAPNNDATLHGITVNGEAISSFDANTFDYQVILPFGTTDLPVVAANPNDASALLDITQAASLPGAASILVTAADGQTQLTYTVNFTLAPNNDATLSSLTIDEVLLEDFNAIKLSYKVELPTGTTTIPVVAATASDANALVDVVQASELPGTAVITVTAEDGETQLVYTVEFTLRVDESYTVTFNVLDEGGNPVEGATVLFNGESKFTDVAGKAVYTEIMPVSEAPFSITKPEAFEEYQGTLSVVDADLTVDVVLLAVGINTERALVSSIYPNPSQGEFTILLHQVTPGTTMTINDLRGSVIIHTELNQLETHIDLSLTKAGVYILRIQSPEQMFKEQIILAK